MVVVFLLLGAVLNVAVAWGIAAMVPINVIFDGRGLFERADAPRWEVRMHSQPGALLVDSNITLHRRVMGRATTGSTLEPGSATTDEGRCCGQPEHQ